MATIRNDVTGYEAPVASPLDPFNEAQYSAPEGSVAATSQQNAQNIPPEVANEYRRLYGLPGAPASPQAAQPTAPQPQTLNDYVDLAKQFLGSQGVDDKQTKKLMEGLDENVKPPELIGNPTFGEFMTGKKGGAGGILGTGITPMDIMAFAIGAAITSRLPQDKAIATTMAIAKMPSQMRQASQKAQTDVIKGKMEAMRLQNETERTKQTQIENAQKFMDFTRKWDINQRKDASFAMIGAGKIDLNTDEGRAFLLQNGWTAGELNAVHRLKAEHTPSVGAEAERLAQMDGYASYADAPREKKAQYEQQINKFKEEAAVRGDARLGIALKAMQMSQNRLDMQQSKALTNVVNIDGKSAATDPSIVQSSTPFRDAAKNGMHYLDKTQLQSLDASNLVLTQLQRMEVYKEKLFKNVNPGENILNNAKLKALYAAGDPAARGFYSLLYEMLPVSTRASGLTAGAAGRLGIIAIEEKINFNRSDTWGSWEEKDKLIKQRMLNNRKIAFGAGIDPELGMRAEQAVNEGRAPEGGAILGPSKKVSR